MKLNEQQIEAVNHLDGPCLVTSVPGSGKTTMLVERTIKLIESGVSPNSILSITFTNKAAKEMRDRIYSRLGDNNVKMFVGTFHSLCANLLKLFGEDLGYDGAMSILDDTDQKDYISKIIKQLGYDKTKDGIDISFIVNQTNRLREKLLTYDEILDEMDNIIYRNIIEEYFKQLSENNSCDFTGLLYNTVIMLEGNEETLNKLRGYFKYIQVDEVQDTNYAQFQLVKLLGGTDVAKANIVLIGDLEQCIAEGTLLQTEIGKKKIEDIIVGDKVLSASGRGKTRYQKVLNKFESSSKDLIEIETRLGKKIISTSEHIFFASFKDSDLKSHFVYLMYKKELGYRLGITKSSGASNGKMGFANRLRGEHADKIWILEVFDTEKEARFWEYYLSIKYRIPTWTFVTHAKGKSIYDQKQIDRLFLNIDTETYSKKIMEDYGLFFDYPHHSPKCMTQKERRNFIITLCVDPRSKTVFHHYAISGSNQEDAKKLMDSGLKIRDAKKAKGWRVDGVSGDLAKIKGIYDIASNVLDVNLLEKARLTDDSLLYMPASSLRRNMTTFVYHNGIVIEDIIISAKRIYDNKKVYDLNIEHLHNFIGNDIVSHNSIYSFRGARYKNILDFISEYNCKKITLSKNYRSTPQIIEKAGNLIKHNTTHLNEEFLTDNPSGTPVYCESFFDSSYEAQHIAGKIKDYINEFGWELSDVAIFYRLNRMSLDLQIALSNAGVPYTVIGGQNFFDRKEIKDCLAFLKFAANPKDVLAFHRVAEILPGLGSINIGMIENKSKENNITLLDTCLRIKEFSNRVSVIKGATKISDIFSQNISKLNPGDCLAHLVNKFEYTDHLGSFCKKESELLDRKNNVSELVINATEFSKTNDSINSYLQNISLISSSDKEGDKNTVTLMTLHASKGLEFPIVFMIGVEQGVLPHNWSILEAKTKEEAREALEEETRLCYVGMTRAKKHLHLSYCQNRKFRDRTGQLRYKVANPSQFLFEANLLDKNMVKVGSIYSRVIS